MITCRELVELLIDYVSDELPAERRVYLEQHLEQCPPCVAYLESYQVTIKLTRRLPATPLPEELASRLRAAVEAIRRQPPEID
ncbi:MAG TPA: zf-HC2 domain-containing protein [Gemmataceae bacterium]|nr:zf-HC2 domain-containing protein [Gemmataceae bacterium]